MSPVPKKAMLVRTDHPIAETEIRVLIGKIQKAIEDIRGFEANEIIVKQEDFERMNEAADELGLPVTVNDKMTPRSAFWICRREE